MPTCAPIHTVGVTSDLHLLFDLIFVSFAKRFDWKHRRMMLETGWWKMTVWKVFGGGGRMSAHICH